jgi:tetratricopeptide (TPR) repeat protein
MADGDTIAPRKPRAPRRRKDAELPDTPDPIEIAMKAMATGADRHGSAQAVLEKHACLIDIQCAREKEELAVLRVQRLTRWLVLAAVAGLLVGLGALLWGAARSSSLVIEPFGVPPALAERGLTGKVVSARLLDRLAELQRQTESMRGEKSYANNWQDDIKLDIPQTGVSLGEAWRTLKGWLGEETRIGGEVVQTSAGLSITTRAGSLSGAPVEGPEAEMSRLIEAAAASVYKVTQPYRYAISRPAGAEAEREQVLLELSGHPSEVERKWALSGLSVSAREAGDYRRARAMALRALAIDPELLPALGNLGLAERGLAHDEAMLAAFRKQDGLWRRGTPEGYDLRVAALNRANANAMAAERLGDAAAMLAHGRLVEAQGASTFSSRTVSLKAGAAALRHEFAAASRHAAGFEAAIDPEDLVVGATLTARIAMLRAVENGDRAAARVAAAKYLGGADGSFLRWISPDRTAEAMARLVRPEIAIALARLGLAQEARALAAKLPADCYECLRARGWAAAAGGERAGAERWFHEAVRQGPSIPMAYADLGELSLRAGDAAGASTRFAEAHEKGPGWGDPLKLWGDALSRQGKAEEALRKYEAAAQRAQRWGALHIEWGKALWRSGEREEARAKFRSAAGMDLSVSDRARLRRIWAAANGSSRGSSE